LDVEPPVGGPLIGRGDANPEKISFPGRGVAREVASVADGSMSSEDKNEVLSRSSFVLVIVRNASNSSLCLALGVPLRSKI